MATKCHKHILRSRHDADWFISFTFSKYLEVIFCLLSIFLCFFCPLLIFFRINFFEKFFQEYHQSVNSLDPDQVLHFFRPDLGPNCLQKLSADDTSWQRVLKLFIF